MDSTTKYFIFKRLHRSLHTTTKRKSTQGNGENQLTREFLCISSEIDYKWHCCLKGVGEMACCGNKINSLFCVVLNMNQQTHLHFPDLRGSFSTNHQ